MFYFVLMNSLSLSINIGAHTILDVESLQLEQKGYTWDFDCIQLPNHLKQTLPEYVDSLRAHALLADEPTSEPTQPEVHQGYQGYQVYQGYQGYITVSINLSPFFITIHIT